MTQEIQLWHPIPEPGPGEDEGDPYQGQDPFSGSRRATDHGSGAGYGTEDDPLNGFVADPGIGEDEQVRYWTTEQLRILIRNLKPYIDGTFGTVSTKHAQVYVSAMRELNRLWKATYVVPPEPEPEPDLEEEERVRIEAATVTRNRVLDQLSELRSRSNAR